MTRLFIIGNGRVTDARREPTNGSSAQTDRDHVRSEKNWQRVAIRYDTCPKVFISAVAYAATVRFRL